MEFTPQITAKSDFQWNKTESIAYINSLIEEQKGLVVTDETLQGAKRSLSDLVYLRNRFKEWANEQKRELKRPFNQFNEDTKEIELIIQRAEQPIREQLDVYEQKAREEKRLKIVDIMDKMQAGMGVRDEFAPHFNPKWLNVSSTFKAIKAELGELFANALAEQQYQDERQAFKQEKLDSLDMFIMTLNNAYDLTTPITLESVQSVVEALPLKEAQSYIKQKFDEQMEIEQNAQKALAEQQKAEQVNNNAIEEPQADTYVVVIKGLTKEQADEIMAKYQGLYACELRG